MGSVNHSRIVGGIIAKRSAFAQLFHSEVIAMAAMWFVLLSHLEDYLQAHVSSKVEQGYSQNELLPEPPVVKVYRIREPDLDIWMRTKGTLIIALDIWENNDDPDPKVANEALATLEEQVQEALKTWPMQAMEDLKIKITDTKFDDVSGDGESYRPQVAAFYKLRINWAK
jgi:hypothetical protein